MTGFTGKKVLVTGASRGIGKAVAMAFAERGARVAVHYHRASASAEAVRSSLPGNGHALVRADLSNANAAIEMVTNATRELNGLDIVVNNAGIFVEHVIGACTRQEWQDAWRRTIDTNLLGPASVCHAAAEIMVAAGAGKIINISSRGAFRGEPAAPAYGASKAGLNAMSQSLAVALAPHGVFVGVVAPGFIETDMASEILAGPEGDSVRAQSPLGRVGRPDEVARAVMFLASDDIDFVTGAIVDVNGASYLRS